MPPDLSPDFFREIRDAEPDAARLAQIQKVLAGSAKKVRPLPSDSALTAFLVAVFVTLAVFITLPIGFNGWNGLSLAKRFLMYGIVLLTACVLALAVTEQMIPGARRRVPIAIAAVFPFLAMGAVIPLLFPEFSLRHFVDHGIPCLRLGLICAIPSGGLAGLFLRRGYPTQPITAALAAGALSGLVGIAVLALHCPIQNAAHILTWHLGVIAIAILGGGALGWVLSRSR